jgi:hypothetical protein
LKLGLPTTWYCSTWARTGRRFVMPQFAHGLPPITVVVNWTSALRKK